MKKTKVICSIGPACDSVEVMGEMVEKGMDCARINLSHATRNDILKTIDVVRKVRKQCNTPVAIMYDTKGPEFRTLEFSEGGVSLNKGDTIKMSKTCIMGNNDEFGVNHAEAIDFIELGDKVLVDNALLELEVIDKKNDYVLLKALGNGKIQNHKTINVPGVDLKLDFISDIDKKDIAFDGLIRITKGEHKFESYNVYALNYMEKIKEDCNISEIVNVNDDTEKIIIKINYK